GPICSVPVTSARSDCTDSLLERDGNLRLRVGDRLDGRGGARDRRDARNARGERSLPDQIAVGSGARALRRVDHEVAAAAANAVGRSAAVAIASPVARIAGPSTGSAPGKRAKGSTAALTLTCVGVGSAGRSSSPRFAPAASRQAAATRLIPLALLANGTVREARGLTSST